MSPILPAARPLLLAVLVLVAMLVPTGSAAASPGLSPGASNGSAGAHAPPRDADRASSAVYRLPVDGRVVAPFDAPRTRFGAGHRGVDLAAAPGTPVHAAGAGVVAFAGSVAGAPWVTIAHPDGLRTSYGVLRDVQVRAGQAVAAGDVLGRAAGRAHPGDAGGGLHVAVRDRSGTYLDPLDLLGGRWVPALTGAGAWTTRAEPSVPHYAPWDGRHHLGLVPGSPVATHPGWVFAPNPNHVIGVAGLGSATGQHPIELTDLGYAAQDITYLSYAGRGGSGAADDPSRDQARYGPSDTWRGVAAAAEKLRDQLRAQWRRSPGQAVDLVGHSMGGVVVAYYLLVLHDPTDPTLPPIGHVATIASPLEGADLARAIVEARKSPAARVGLDLLSAAIPDHDAGSRAVSDLAVGSGLVRDLAGAWTAARAHPLRGPLATGTRVFTFGGSRDPVVPERRSDLPGADHVVLPGAHDSVRRTEAARIALRAFLADRDVPGEAGGAGHWMSYPLGWAEQALGRTLRDAGDALTDLVRSVPVPALP